MYPPKELIEKAITIERMSSATALIAGARFLRSLREIDTFIASQTADCLLTIAIRPGITMQQMSKETGLAQSSCSRIVAMLSKWHRLGKPGFDLVEAIDDPAEPRRKIMFLTAKGQKIVTKAIKTIDEDFVLHSPSAREAVDRIHGAE